MLSNQCA